MWAAFGRLESIPPLAFAMPAMFAKSSTIYNPLVYMLLRPNFRKVMCRDLGALRRACLRACICSSQPPGPGPSKSGPSMGILPLSKSHDILIHTSVHTELTQPRGPKGRACGCSDTYECFRNYPRACCAHLKPKAACVQCLSQDKVAPVTCDLEMQTKRLHCGRVVPRERTEDIDHLEFNLKTVPGHVKVAWP